MDELILVLVTMLVTATATVSIVIAVLRAKRKNRYKIKLDNLDIEKNKIASTPIVSELSKIEAYRKNEKIEAMYNEWNKRLDDIKDIQVPKITDMLLEADYSLSQKDYKATLYKIAKLEIELNKVRTNADFLLEEIKDLTTSEERSRKVITSYKKQYRDLFEKFKASEVDYGEIAEIVNLQFGSIAKKFEHYEDILDNNKYNELDETLESISDMLKHMGVVIDEMPQIVLMATNVIPRKIKEIKEDYDNLKKKGYTLDYLNVDSNIKEAQNKIKDILKRAKDLNMQDSILELKVLDEYFDSLVVDFEKEKVNKEEYEDVGVSFEKRLDKNNKLVNTIFKKINAIKKTYNLDEKDLELLLKIREELKKLNADYKALIDHTGNNSFAFSKLNKEIQNLNARLKAIEESIDGALETIGSMKQDEQSAKLQLKEIKEMLKKARNLMREYNIPIIPKEYFVELQEAQAAVKEIIIELEKTPIDINTLNVRVETARDLVLKLNRKAQEIIKSVAFAEMAIVYGNRYRSEYPELDKHLTYSEMLFFKGEYKKSLDLAIHTLNKIEPGIQNKLLEYYAK